jgi:hypothetical protein
MQIRRFLFLAAGLLFLARGTASAQDAGKTGVTMGYPSSIGIVWHASDRVAIRPELSIAGSSSESSNSSFSAENDSWNLAVGVSALFYLRTYDRLKTYFSPRLTYARSTNENTSSGITTSTITSTVTNTGVSGSFGVQYGLSDKFSVFGELGVGFNHAKTTGSTSQVTTSKGNSWSTRSGVGLIYYF